MTYKKIKVPKRGNKISYVNGELIVPDKPIIPYIEGDGIGVDITPPMINVVNEAVKIAYGNKKRIEWMEVYCGEKAKGVPCTDRPCANLPSSRTLKVNELPHLRV